VNVFNSVGIRVRGVDYFYSQRMHENINKLADIFYSNNGYISRPEFDYSKSIHQKEVAAYYNAVESFVFHKKIKPYNQSK